MNFIDFLFGFILGIALFALIMLFSSTYRNKSRLDKELQAIRSASSELIGEALKQNSLINEISMRSAADQVGSALDTKKAEMDGLLAPVKMQLEKFNNAIESIENKRREDYGNINAYMESLNKATTDLTKETDALKNILSNSQARGKWGEVTLKRIVESAGMVEHVDYEEQSVAENGQRPDMIINLPHERKIIVDAKTPYINYIKATNAPTKEEEKRFLKDFTYDLRRQIRLLSSKDYHSSINSAYDFVIMFLPQESILGIALSTDPEITDFALEQSVVICTPLTLLASLRVIHMSWKQDSLMKNSGEIVKLASSMYNRMDGMLKRMGETSNSIKRLIREFNSLLSYTDSSLLPSMKKINQLGELGNRDLESVDELDDDIRELKHTSP